MHALPSLAQELPATFSLRKVVMTNSLSQLTRRAIGLSVVCSVITFEVFNASLCSAAPVVRREQHFKKRDSLTLD